jgi:hypothetical protein
MKAVIRIKAITVRMSFLPASLINAYHLLPIAYLIQLNRGRQRCSG